MTPMSKPDMEALAHSLAGSLEEYREAFGARGDRHEIEFTSDELDTAIKSLRRTAATASDAEPVAWQIELTTAGKRGWHNMPGDWSYAEEAVEGCVYRPLYASPRPTNAEWDEAIEALILPLQGFDENQKGYQHRKGWNDAVRRVMDLRRALSRPASEGERDTKAEGGWKLMPPEATREMTMAGCDCLPACEHVFGHAGELLRKSYRQMFAAAPATPAREPDAAVSEEAKTLIEIDALLCRFLNDSQRPEEFLHDARRAILALIQKGRS